MPFQTRWSHQEVCHCVGTWSRFYYKSDPEQNPSFELVSPLTSMAISCLFFLFFKIALPLSLTLYFLQPFFPKRQRQTKPNQRGVKQLVKCNNSLCWVSFIVVCPSSFFFFLLIYLVCVIKCHQKCHFPAQACPYHGKGSNTIMMLSVYMNLLFIVLTFHAQVRFWQRTTKKQKKQPNLGLFFGKHESD